MTFPNPLRVIAGLGIAAAITLGAAPLASASAGGADPYVPSGTNPMVPMVLMRHRFTAPTYSEATEPDPAQVYGPSAGNPAGPSPFVAGGPNPPTPYGADPFVPFGPNPSVPY